MYLYLFEYSCTYPRSTGASQKKKRTKYNVEIITMYNKVRRAYDKFIVHDIAMLRDGLTTVRAYDKFRAL
jgi:hypothetical protein